MGSLNGFLSSLIGKDIELKCRIELWHYICHLDADGRTNLKEGPFSSDDLVYASATIPDKGDGKRVEDILVMIVVEDNSRIAFQILEEAISLESVDRIVAARYIAKNISEKLSSEELEFLRKLGVDVLKHLCKKREEPNTDDV